MIVCLNKDNTHDILVYEKNEINFANLTHEIQISMLQFLIYFNFLLSK